MRKLGEILTLLQTLPTGSLISKRIRGYIRYYHQYYENARRIQKYIRKADEPHMLQHCTCGAGESRNGSGKRPRSD